MAFSKPCAINSTGFTLYRWPMRSVFIPLERLDRFDVVWEQADSAGDSRYERLVLFTSDGMKIPVQAVAIEWLGKWRGLLLQTRALQLNNHICSVKRSM